MGAGLYDGAYETDWHGTGATFGEQLKRRLVGHGTEEEKSSKFIQKKDFFNLPGGAGDGYE